jgi:ubiquitin-like 1-activating enzyme E1 A
MTTRSSKRQSNDALTPAKKSKLTHDISVDEVKLYDRQIRLWGMGAQTIIRNTSICIINMQGLSQEVLKNIVLAGVGSITLCDHTKVVAKDLASQFFLRDEDIGKYVFIYNLRKLNV